MRAPWIAALIVSSGTVAHAATPPPAWAAECAERDDDAARLACYDSQNPPRKKAAKAQTQDSTPRAPSPANTASASPARAPAPEAATAQASTPQALPSHSATAQTSAPAPQPSAQQPTTLDNFGLSESRKRDAAPPQPAEPTELNANVASVSQRLTGELLLKLDNGQSWVQSQRNSAVHIKAGERVSIARGAFGGYLLRSDSGASMRVRRLE